MSAEARSVARRARARLGLRARATVAAAGLAAVISCSLALIAHTTLRWSLIEQRESAARRQAFANARLVRDALQSPLRDPSSAFPSLQQEEGGHALVRAGGRWYASSLAIEPQGMPDDLLRLVGGGAAATQRFELRGVPHLAVGVALPAVGARYYEVVPLARVEDTLQAVGVGLLGAAAATTGIGALAGFFLAGRIVRPLHRMAETLDALIQGGSPEGFEAPDAELEPLVGALNRAIEGFASRAEREARFASDVSHELRAPLAALSAAVDVMERRREQLPEGTVLALDALGDQIHGFQQLVLDLLEMARADAGRAELVLEPCDPELLVEEALVAIGAREVPVSVDPDVPRAVLLDRRRISQTVVNLVENARRYAGGPTAILVGCDDGCLVVAVEDHGPGVPPEDREVVFQRFERGSLPDRSNVPTGTGLGLSLVAEHARLHGGHAHVEDAAGGGARFVVTIPVRLP